MSKPVTEKYFDREIARGNPTYPSPITQIFGFKHIIAFVQEINLLIPKLKVVGFLTLIIF